MSLLILLLGSPVRIKMLLCCIKMLHSVFIDDGCHVTDVPFCTDLGLDKITVPGPTGATDFDSAREILFLYNAIIYNETLAEELEMSGQCRRSLSELMCGIWTPNCVGGEAAPVCKEICEGTVCCNELL